MNRRFLVPAALALGVIAVLVFRPKPDSGTGREGDVSAFQGNSSRGEANALQKTPSLNESPEPEVISVAGGHVVVLPAALEFAAGLDRPGGSPEGDMEIVHEAVAQYRRVFGSNPPGGENREIVAALRGENPRRLAVLPPDLKSLNENGEIVDRWGTPYLFHPVSGEVMEVLSAGPDQKLWTADDIGQLTPVGEPTAGVE